MIILATTLVTLVTLSVKAEAQPQDEVIGSSVELYIWEVANEFDLDYYLLASLVWQESRFIVMDNLTQITNPKWFKEGIEYAGTMDIKNPYINIKVCGYYIHKWAEEYEGEPALWLMMWNEGYENALSHYDPLHPSRYARQVIKRAEQWQQEGEKQ